ncbi:MAG: hypothetical protein JW895_10910 [Thermoleophilaceae bacterium]|nr:hypothetical protein [Thermoleophilaceae bacterium]
MGGRRRLLLFVSLAVVALTASSCAYYKGALDARDSGGGVPWWCKSSEEIPVTSGPAVGTVDWYAGTHKAPLAWDQCLAMSVQFDAGKKFAEEWPTRGAAEADGWREITGYVPGMGTHHARGGITPAMLNSPSFNRQNPILDSVGLDDKFDVSTPDVLQFDGNGANARLVGYDYYVRTNTGRPPEGFPGNLDWWHHHPWICHRKTDAAMIAFNTSDANCTSLGGINVNLSNYYMLHVWVLDDMKFLPDVFAGQIPCISGGTAIHDPNDPCHFSRTGTTTASLKTGPGGPLTTASASGPSFVCHMEEAARTTS